MPKANLTVDVDNSLLIKFNDTITRFEISSDDLIIQIYGSQRNYKFNWTANFISDSSVLIELVIISSISGYDEIVNVEFPLANNFKSAFSHRPTNPNEALTGELNAQAGSSVNSASFGQTTVYLYLFSVGLTLISSFGGNSMEMMWKFTNTVQLFYFISMINLNFPSNLDNFFPYLQASNADNPYLRSFSSMIVSEDNFDQTEINDRIGNTSFYIANADKLPWLIPVTILFFL